MTSKEDRPPERETEDRLPEREEEVARRVLALVPRLAAAFEGVMRRHRALSFDRLKVLRALARGGPMRSGALAERLYLTPAAVSHAVDGLVSEGLVRREEDPEDRRAVILDLTSRGRQELRRCDEILVLALAAALRRLGPERRERVAQAFTDLEEAFGEMSPSAQR